MAGTVDTLTLQVRGDIADLQAKLKQAGVEVASFGKTADRTGAAVGGANRVMTDFGRIANDAQQFAYGWRQGLVAVGNQLDGFVVGLRQTITTARGAGESVAGTFVRALLSPTGLVAGLNLALGALVVFGPKIAEAFGRGSQAAEGLSDDVVEMFRRVGESADDARERIERTISSLFEFAEVGSMGLDRDETRFVLSQAASRAGAVRAELEGAIADARTAERISDLGGGPVDPALLQRVYALKEQYGALAQTVEAASTSLREFAEAEGALSAIGLLPEATVTGDRIRPGRPRRGGRGPTAEELKQRGVDLHALKLATIPDEFAGDLQILKAGEVQMAALAGTTTDWAYALVEAADRSGIAARRVEELTRPAVDFVMRMEAALGLAHGIGGSVGAFAEDLLSFEALFDGNPETVFLDLGRAAESFAVTAGNAIERVIADLARAAATAALLKFIIGPLFGMSFGGSFGSIFGALLGGGSVAATSNAVTAPVSVPASAVNVNSTLALGGAGFRHGGIFIPMEQIHAANQGGAAAAYRSGWDG